MKITPCGKIEENRATMPSQMLKIDNPIQTSRLVLRPFQTSDLADLFEFHSLPAVAQFLYWDARNRDETKQALDRKIGQTHWIGEESVLCFAVVLKASNQVIGEVSLFWRSVEHKQGEIGYVFHPNYGGRGYATEAVQIMLTLGFDELTLHRIFGRCDPRNVASWKLLERLGMRREAHFVQNEIFKGE